MRGGLLREVAGGVVDLLWPLPQGCPACGRASRGGRFCEACRRQLGFPPVPSCPRCGLPAPVAARPSGLCDVCAAQLWPFTRLLAAAPYREPLRGLLHCLKFRRERHLARPLGEFLAERLAGRWEGAEVAVPVPLSAARLRERGFNQAQLLAEAMVRGRVPVVEALRRAPGGARQSLARDRAERRANRPQLACVRQETVAGRRILLVDDVFTTGVTMTACADALLRAGARSVTAAVLCRDL
ncbi:MAG: ComF family protein [Firmicutes bacterium]|nr:ComF family protein [Bacillota bacterium]